jgi:hypothetical protein
MNLKPLHLEEIRLSAMHGARGIRARGVECRAVLLLINSTPGGELGTLTAIDVESADKDTRTAMQRKFARSPDVAAAVLINEGWQSIIAPGAKVPNTTEGDPLRQEVLLINCMTAREQWLAVAEIHGNKIDEAQFQKVENGNLIGRFIRAEAA